MGATEFSLRVDEQPGDVIVRLAGVISETSKLEVPDPRGRRVVIDPGAVERINSLGVRSWLGMMERLEASASEVVFMNLPPVLVSQASMISSFLGRARVETFLSPWICPSCDTTHDQLHRGTDPLPLAIACPTCQTPMELDWDRDHFTAFREL